MADQSFEPGGVNVSINGTTLSAGVNGLSFGLPVREELRNRFTWTVDFAGTPTTPDIRLQGSLDDSYWADLDIYTDLVDTMRHVVNTPVRYIRARIEAGSGTTVIVKIVA